MKEHTRKQCQGNPGETDWVEMLLFTASNGENAEEVMLRECQVSSLSSASNLSYLRLNH